jgi:transcriptional regulator
MVPPKAGASRLGERDDGSSQMRNALRGGEQPGMKPEPPESNLYVPRHFAMTDLGEVRAFMQRVGICTLVTLGDELEASLVPVAIEGPAAEYGTLRGHLAKPNHQLSRRREDVRALAVFAGPAHYITPSWYETKRRTGKVVPTYDYVVVQARGFLRTIDDPARVRDHLSSLTAHHEATVDSDWRITDAPDDYITSMMLGIVAFEMPIDELVGKWKLSQNRPADDIDGVVHGLADLATDAARDVAELVERSRPRTPG